jgi:hypothetical protein
MCQKCLVIVFAKVDAPVFSFVTGKLQRSSPEILKKFSMPFFFLLAATSKGQTE